MMQARVDGEEEIKNINMKVTARLFKTSK